MAPLGVRGSAVLAAAVFVAGAVSSPLAASGECPVGAGERGRKRGVLAAPRAESWHSCGTPALDI